MQSDTFGNRTKLATTVVIMLPRDRYVHQLYANWADHALKVYEICTLCLSITLY